MRGPDSTGVLCSANIWSQLRLVRPDEDSITHSMRRLGPDNNLVQHGINVTDQGAVVSR